MAQRVRRRKDDDRAARPPDSPLRHRRDRQRQLALQKPRRRSRSPRSHRLRNPDQLRRRERYRQNPAPKGVKIGRRHGVKFERRLTSGEGFGRLGNLSTPKTVQKLQKALHAKAKAEAGYRFYALYDKISRDDILAHAYAQCRSNKGAPGVDGQDFTDIETYGVERWLGELALALREETYRPEPIRRVFIPKANGKLRPLGIATLRDRVCMTAATLVLEAIFEADLPPEQYAYRPGRNAQQAVVEVEELVFRGAGSSIGAWLNLIKIWLDCPVEETDDRG